MVGAVTGLVYVGVFDPFAAGQARLHDRAQGASYQCSLNTYDCSDFRTRSDAQSAYRACGGLQNDVHWLDHDRDGRACERLP